MIFWGFYFVVLRLNDIWKCKLMADVRVYSARKIVNDYF